MASPIQTILCPVDFSDASEEAVRYAVSLAERIGASDVRILHVHQPVAHVFPESAVVFDAEVIDDARVRMSRRLEELAKRYSGHGVDVSARLVDGVPYAMIVEHAGEVEADLVVMGTHGRTGLAHFLLGSTAERVVRASRIPVCTVRAPG
ncbi:MAG: universal stress protein [Myxococcota bacterium]|nr:universal stress protein [Myxococcota bacterium]